MKLIHLSDLHLGKMLNKMPLIEDQKYILDKIIEIIKDEKPDGVLIAGDVYDRSIPSTEAVKLLDDFILELAENKIETFIISGNHDSAERLSFANELIDMSGIHISSTYFTGKGDTSDVRKFTLKDGAGDVDIYMLPFVKPAVVREKYPDAEIKDYTDAVRVAISHMDIDKSKRNVLIAHQFVTGATKSDSEEIMVGGLDNVDSSVFDGFDYVALGHIHGPQFVGLKKASTSADVEGADIELSKDASTGKLAKTSRIRYSGTPLKYSLSEKDHNKSVTVIELGSGKAKDGLCDYEIRTIQLKPLRDVIEIKGKFDEIRAEDYHKGMFEKDNYIHVILNDESEIKEALNTLRKTYPNIISLEYNNTRTKKSSHVTTGKKLGELKPDEIFAELFEEQNGRPLSKEEKKVIDELIKEVWED